MTTEELLKKQQPATFVHKHEIIRVHTHQPKSPTTKAINDVEHKFSNQSITSSSSYLSRSEHYNTTHQHEEEEEKEGFAACLLTMDDNHYLVEWLAYHYTVLPLRRLIVAVDPNSTTSPHHIFNRYRKYGLMEISEWNDTQFMPRKVPHEHRKNQPKLHLYRQRRFLLQCLRQLQQEQKWTWVTHIDSDEYVLSDNMYLKSHYQLKNKNDDTTTTRGTTTPAKSTTIFDQLNNPSNVFKFKNRPIPNSCRPMGRLNMGNKEKPSPSPPSTTTSSSSSPPPQQQQQNATVMTTNHDAIILPDGFTEQDFMTLRYQYPKRSIGGSQQKNQQKLPGKMIVDVSTVNMTLLQKLGTNAHSILRKTCPQAYIWSNPTTTPFFVYHYAGTMEQFTYRNGDGREKRSIDKYKERFYNTSKPDTSATKWITAFMEQVGGNQVASELLQNISQVEKKTSTHHHNK